MSRKGGRRFPAMLAGMVTLLAVSVAHATGNTKSPDWQVVAKMNQGSTWELSASQMALDFHPDSPGSIFFSSRARLISKDRTTEFKLMAKQADCLKGDGVLHFRFDDGESDTQPFSFGGDSIDDVLAESLCGQAAQKLKRGQEAAFRLSAPDIAQNGAVVPIEVHIAQGLRAGQSLQIYVEDEHALTLNVTHGVLQQFHTRLRLPEGRIEVSVRRSGQPLSHRHVEVRLGVNSIPRDPDFKGDQPLLSLSGTSFRALWSADSIAKGIVVLYSDELQASVATTGFVSPSALFAFVAGEPLNGACITLRAGQVERQRCAAGR